MRDAWAPEGPMLRRTPHLAAAGPTLPPLPPRFLSHPGDPSEASSRRVACVTSSPSLLSGRVVRRRLRPQLVSRELGSSSGRWKLGEGVLKEKVPGVEVKFLLTLPQANPKNDILPHFNDVLVLINRSWLFLPG